MSTRQPVADVSRRDVLLQSLALAGLPPPCCTTPTVPAGSFHFEAVTLVVDLEAAPELRRVGSAAAIVDAAREVNLLVACTERRRYVALDRSCTHGGAQCAYNHRRRTLQCTSLNHAEYALDGALLHGRSHGNLRTYETRCAGSRLEIRLVKRT
jgi:nitrite reductase/ring-hydroxylating ferredoxin subunit